MEDNRLTLEEKKLIARFMKYEILHEDSEHPYCDPYSSNEDVNSLPMLEFMFDDYNSLISVVQKILDINKGKIIDECTSDEWFLLDNINRLHITTPIKTVIDTVIRYIEWYNVQNS